MIQNFRAKAGKLDLLFTGHNIYALHADIYLDNLEKAAQKIVDYGFDGSLPTLRPAAESFGSSRVAVEGNYQVDLHSAIINLGLLLSDGLTPENNCKLSCIRLLGAECTPAFNEDIFEYTLHCKSAAAEIIPVTSSTRSVLELNGAKWASGAAHDLSPDRDLCLRITAPDCRSTREYVFHVK